MKEGDVVKLKSGGPKMTVAKIDQDARFPITCQWFKEGYEVAEDTFTVESLEVIENGN